MDNDTLTRREMVEATLRAAGRTTGMAFFAAWLKGAQLHQHSHPPSAPLANYQPQFFNAEDFAALEAFTAILIPTDATPGAKEAHCAHFIDFVLQASEETPETQRSWRNAMEHLRQAGFHHADASQQLRIVTEISKPESDPHAHHAAFAAYRLIKQQTAFAFYTSRQGTLETLDYRGNSYNVVFPACTHPEHQTV